MPRLPRLFVHGKLPSPATPATVVSNTKTQIRRFPFPFSTAPLVRIPRTTSTTVPKSHLSTTIDVEVDLDFTTAAKDAADQPITSLRDKASPMKPFPLPLRIGTDVCYIPRIRALLSGKCETAERFVRKLLNEEERAGQVARAFGGLKYGNFLAGRWAAKEATIKAYPNYRLTMQDITITAKQHADGTSGAPIAFVKILNEQSKVEELREVRVSISHDGDYATAVCLAAAEEAYKGFE